MKKSIKYLFVLSLMAGVSVGCDNFLNPHLAQVKTTQQAIKSVSDLQNTVNGAIHDLADTYNLDNIFARDFIVTNVVSSDNAYSSGSSGRMQDQDGLSYTPDGADVQIFWEHFYSAIADLNLAIQQSSKLKNADQKRVNFVVGQAYALKGLSYLDLLMSYGQQYVNGGTKPGGIPIRVGFGNSDNIPRQTVDASWDSIGTYFNKAITLMDSSQEFDKFHMNYWAARGLQARYALYHGDWDLVKTACKDIINNGPFKLVAAKDYAGDWSSDNGPQALWSIGYNQSFHPPFENIASIYRVIPGKTTYGDIVVTKDLYNLYGPNDVRKKLYTVRGGLIRMSGKYTKISGLDPVRIIRYAEVLLDYAEALARTGDQGQAKTIINNIAKHRNEKSYSSGSVQNVLLERRKELAMEGFHFFDMLRNKKPIVPVAGKKSNLNKTLQPGAYQLALPIPRHEINANGKVKQNKGYK
jgi:hypothetical protein